MEHYINNPSNPVFKIFLVEETYGNYAVNLQKSCVKNNILFYNRIIDETFYRVLVSLKEANHMDETPFSSADYLLTDTPQGIGSYISPRVYSSDGVTVTVPSRTTIAGIDGELIRGNLNAEDLKKKFLEVFPGLKEKADLNIANIMHYPVIFITGFSHKDDTITRVINSIRDKVIRRFSMIEQASPSATEIGNKKKITIEVNSSVSYLKDMVTIIGSPKLRTANKSFFNDNELKVISDPKEATLMLTSFKEELKELNKLNSFNEKDEKNEQLKKKVSAIDGEEIDADVLFED